MKKLILTILLFVLPISLIDAYPNEPSGYASMYLGESLNKVKARYNTSFLRYNQARTGGIVHGYDTKCLWRTGNARSGKCDLLF